MLSESLKIQHPYYDGLKKLYYNSYMEFRWMLLWCPDGPMKECSVPPASSGNQSVLLFHTADADGSLFFFFFLLFHYFLCFKPSQSEGFTGSLRNSYKMAAVWLYLPLTLTAIILCSSLCNLFINLFPFCDCIVAVVPTSLWIPFIAVSVKFSWSNFFMVNN